MNVLELFAGIGGIGLGLERAGMTVVGQVEMDPFCRRVLAKHWPEVPRHDDVRTAVDWWRSEPRPRVDLAAAGFPCQPVSVAGRRKGADDERWLWPAVAAIIRALRPRWALLENVPGLLASGMGDVLGDLAACGYDADWDCIPAAAVGAPHLRDRVFIVAHAVERTHVEGVPQPGERSVAGSDGEGPHTVADADDVGRDGRPGIVGSARRSEPAHGRGDVADAYREPVVRAPVARPERHYWSVEPDVGRVASRIPPGLDGGLNAHPECVEKGRTAGVPETRRLRALREHIAATEAPSRPERCHLCGHPLSALPCRGTCAPWHLGGRVEEAEGLRCVREGVLGLLACSREDLFPSMSLGAGENERSQAVGRRVDRLRALGNAVVPQVAEHVGRLILAADRELATTLVGRRRTSRPLFLGGGSAAGTTTPAAVTPPPSPGPHKQTGATP